MAGEQILHFTYVLPRYYKYYFRALCGVRALYTLLFLRGNAALSSYRDSSYAVP